MNSTPEKSEKSHPPKRSFKQRALRTAGAVGLTASLYGAGVATHAEFFKGQPKPAISAEDVKNAAVKASMEEVTAHDSALDLASLLQETLNQNQSAANMRVLNGVIEAQDKDGKFRPSLRNPILLTTLESAAKPNADGKFLEGGWIGIQGNDANGDITISANLFDSKYLRFVPFDPNELFLTNIGVYSTSVSNGKDSSGALTSPNGHELIAFDLTGENSVKNPDNSIVSPGLVLPQN